MLESYMNNKNDPQTEHRTRDLDTTECLDAIRMLLDIIKICNGPDSVRSVGYKVLRRLCAYDGWYAGRLYVHDDDGGPERRWEHLDEQGAGLPTDELPVMFDAIHEEVVRSGEPTWQYTEFTKDTDRAMTGMCAPITTNGRLRGAIAFFTSSRPPPTREVRSAIETVSTLFAGVLERRTLDRTIAEVVSEEQHRIGRELHDSMSQELGGAALMGDAMIKRLEKDGSDEARTARLIVSAMRNTLGSIHSITEDLIPMDIGGYGLDDALRLLAERLSARWDAAIELRGACPELPPRMGRELYQIASEAARNALSHGSPSRVDFVWETRDDGRSTLEIRDDGSGFDPQDNSRNGRGLAIMRHRAGMIDAQFEVESKIGNGTTIRCTLPPAPRGAGEKS